MLIITGAPCAGKTTVGRRLAGDLALPFFSKDELKEILFEELGWGERSWSQQLGRGCTVLLYHLARQELAVGRSVALECNFVPDLAAPPLRALQGEFGCRIVQLLCTCSPELIGARWRERAQAGLRHPGHNDQRVHDQIDPVALLRKHGTLPLEGELLHVATDDFSEQAYGELRAAVEVLLGGHRETV